jgi:hypothetical protein
LESEINGLGGELVGLYYASYYDGSWQSVSEVSDHLDSYGWTGGWRITDTTDKLLFYAADPADPATYLWAGTPNVFIVDTVQMKIVAAELGSTQLDVIAELEAIAGK